MRPPLPRPAATALAAMLATVAVPPAGGPARVTRTVYLMGTRATLVTADASREAARARLDRMLRVLEATEAELSTWRDDSELGRLNAAPRDEPFQVSDRLCRTLSEVRRWVTETGGAVDPAVKPLIDAWRIRSGGAVPRPADLDRARLASGFARLRFDSRTCRATPAGAVALDAGAFGKGEALDRAAATAGPGAAWLIDLGGQVLASGAPPGAGTWTVDVAHPRRRDTAVLTLALGAGSVATSGGSERDRQVDGARIGHILDPRTGRPAEFDGSVTVRHERALVADLLSTALYVMGPEAGLAWAEARDIAALFLEADADGGPPVTRATRAFARRFGEKGTGAFSGAPWSEKAPVPCFPYDTGVSGIGRR